MDNNGLSLHHFGHVFEIFAGYYLLLGTNKTFHNYFNLSILFRRWPLTYEEKKRKVKQYEESLKPWTVTIKVDSKDGLVKVIQKIFQSWRKSSAANKLRRKAVELNKILVFLDFHLESHFKEKLENERKDKCEQCGREKCEGCGMEKPEKDGETDFHKFIKPFYILYGTLAVSLLVFCGIYEEWKMIPTLSIINILTLLITIYLALEIWLNYRFKMKFKMWDPLYVFVYSILILFVFIIIPSDWSKLLCFIPYFLPHNLISFNDLQIMGITALILLPIVFHILALFKIVKNYNKMERLLNQIGKGIINIENQPTIINPDSLPNL